MMRRFGLLSKKRINNNNTIIGGGSFFKLSTTQGYATIRLVDRAEERRKERQEEEDKRRESTNNNHQQDNNSNNNNSGGEKKEPFISLSQFLFFGIPAITTFCLGIWQTRRYLWKKDQIKLREVTLAQEPIPYNGSEMLKTSPVEEPSKEASAVPSLHEKTEENYDPINPAKDEYVHRIVTLEGYFDYSKEIVVGLRKSPLTKRLDLPTSMGEMGYFILTPFVMKDGEVVMVNRGWVPKTLYHNTNNQNNSSITPDFEKKITDTNSIEKITAIIRPGEYLGAGISDSYDGKTNKFIAMDLFSIAKYYEMSYIPLLVDQFHHFQNFVYDEKQTSENSLKASQSQPNKYPMISIPDDYMKFYITPATHVAYMATWYSLCLWIIGTFVYFKRKKRISNF